MRPLTLDFQPRRRSGPLGWGLLGLGLAVAIGCVIGQQQLDQWAAQQHTHLRHAQRQLTGDSGAGVSLTPAQLREQEQNLAQMRQVSQQLRRPWERLFAMLEALQLDNVALLTLTPDARKGQVRITAEARDLDAMLDFHRQLEASEELSDVSLLNHEIDAKSPEHPVQFNLLANWEIGDAHP
ncbi:MAG: PilN domain-containing protein [Pseudomonas sp.]|uniref:PilN domain-containing protein n=1 Tax=Pseudomonas abieticivorans TaxID=2931382 RepID=UPI0020BF9C63|nr:PilN domain-containing protein [Pseudomonas sp. PIA16]MDE1164588.1 PilN domain-containing protein [Pseudomonas sp.]